MNSPSYQLFRIWFWLYRFQTLRAANWLFRNATPETIVPVSLFGYSLPLEVARTTTHRMLALLGERHIAERDLVMRLVRRGDRVCDVGANIGYYLLMFARQIGPEGRIDCIEPEPANLVQLRRVVRVNALANVEVHSVAVGDRPGLVQLQEGINGRVQPEGKAGCEVKVITLDSMQQRDFTFIKIDIEGYEGQALAGMTGLMKANAPRLFVEVHPALLEFGFSVRDVIALVRPYYRRIEFWEQAKGESAWSKAAIRYLPERGVRQLADEADLLQACEAGRRRDPFWMICN